MSTWTHRSEVNCREMASIRRARVRTHVDFRAHDVVDMLGRIERHALQPLVFGGIQWHGGHLHRRYVKAILDLSLQFLRLRLWLCTRISIRPACRACAPSTATPSNAKD